MITKSEGHGDEVTRLPIPYPVDGKQNIAEALARIYDNSDRTLKLKDLAKASVTLIRPAPNGVGKVRIYPVIWHSSTQAPTPLTNYGIVPGDRFFVTLKRKGSPSKGAPKQSFSPQARVTHSSRYREAANEMLPSGTGQFYRLQTRDTLKLRVTRPDRPAYTLTWGDFEGEFTLNQDGEVKLGRDTGGGAVSVAGLTANETHDAIEQHLRKQSSAEAELQLAISQLAAEKYVISIQRADGTELAVGALRPDYLSKSDFLVWPIFR